LKEKAAAAGVASTLYCGTRGLVVARAASFNVNLDVLETPRGLPKKIKLMAFDLFVRIGRMCEK